MAFRKAKALQEAEKLVAQGKIAQAIKQYQDILENDPSDVSLLNTVGDLYIRERNFTEGLKQFHKLAEAYVREGFNVKAIAIYRKISKVDPNSVETLAKLGDLYQVQGLSREAREQFLQAADIFKKRNQTERAIEVLRKLVQLDPENISFQNRLAGECEEAGKNEEAAKAYLDSAEILVRRGDQVAAGPALKKAAELEPKNSKVQILRARVALAQHEPEEAEKIINAAPELQSDPAIKRILFDSYLGMRRLPEAEKLVREVYEANPADFAPLAAVAALQVENGEIERAFQLLAGVADALLRQNQTGPLQEALRGVWAKAPAHIPTLELIQRICEHDADELTLPDVLEALGHAYEQAGELDKAEATYLKLRQRQPDDENYRGLLKAVQEKMGKEATSDALPHTETLLEAEEEPFLEQVEVDADQEAMVKEALENSDLFARYNLPEKAILELEKVLQVYPDQIDVHRRILEISRKGHPDRGAAAAAQLARIFEERGDPETAEKYRQVASNHGAVQEAAPPRPANSETTAPPAPPPQATRTAETAEPSPSVAAAQDVQAPPGGPPPPDVSLEPASAPDSAEISGGAGSAAASAEKTTELDLSGDLEEMAALVEDSSAATGRGDLEFPQGEGSNYTGIPAPPAAAGHLNAEELAIPPAEPPPDAPETESSAEQSTLPPELEESKIEIEFYLENGFLEEAGVAVAVLEDKYQDSPIVAELRRQLDLRVAGQNLEPTAEASSPVAQEAAPTPPVETAAIPQATPPAEEPPWEEWDLPTTYAVAISQEPAAEPVTAPPPVVAEVADSTPVVPVEPEPAPPPPAVEPVTAPPPVAAEVADSTPVIPVEPEPAPPPPAVEPVAAPPPVVAEVPESTPVVPVEPEAAPPPPAVEPVTTPPPSVAELADSTPVVPVEPEPAPPPPAPVPAVEEPAEAEGSAPDLLGELAEGVGEFLGLLEPPPGPPAVPPPETPVAPVASPASPIPVADQLSGLLAEMEGSGAGAEDDPETHYHLGVAFREMGLLDESIAEFQKVMKNAGKDRFPPNSLQACSLLAICFMEKKMPAIAVKWYLRALETPGLDDEARTALHYDLGLAYDLVGDARNALESFTEVYSQNIDYRDVAEKIRELQQKAGKKSTR